MIAKVEFRSSMQLQRGDPCWTASKTSVSFIPDFLYTDDLEVPAKAARLPSFNSKTTAINPRPDSVAQTFCPPYSTISYSRRYSGKPSPPTSTSLSLSRKSSADALSGTSW